MKNIKMTLLVLLLVSGGYTAFGQQQLNNPGFELWEEFGFGPDTLEPVNWNSLKSSDGGDFINSVIPVTLERSTDAHSGNYSVKLRNDTILIFVAPGTMTNGRVHATLPPTDAYVYTVDSLPEFHTPFTDKPDSLTFWAKYFPTVNDIAHVIAVLHTDTAKIADPAHTNWVAVANVDIAGQSANWTRFSAPFVYLNSDTPEYILFAIFAGDAANAIAFSELYLDDFELIYYNTGIETETENEFQIGVSGNEMLIQLDEKFMGEKTNLEISDLTGRIVFSKEFYADSKNTFQVDFKKGVYVCRIKTTNLILSQKFVKN